MNYLVWNRLLFWKCGLLVLVELSPNVQLEEGWRHTHGIQSNRPLESYQRQEKNRKQTVPSLTIAFIMNDCSSVSCFKESMLYWTGKTEIVLKEKQSKKKKNNPTMMELCERPRRPA